MHLIDLSETDLANAYKKIKFELSAYDKNLGKKEIVFFNKSDLVEPDIVNERLKEFISKVKIKFEIISTLSNKIF